MQFLPTEQLLKPPLGITVPLPVWSHHVPVKTCETIAHKQAKYMSVQAEKKKDLYLVILIKQLRHKIKGSNSCIL